MSMMAYTIIKNVVALPKQRDTAVILHVLVQQMPLTALLYQPPQVDNKMEEMNIMVKFPVGHVHICTATLKAILAHQKQNKGSCFKTSIYCMLANHAKGVIISGEFTGKGRPPIYSDTDMKQIAEALEEEVGKTYNKYDVKMMIKKIQPGKLEKAGLD
jgi:hypothetical protein